ESCVFVFFLEGFKPRVALDRDRLAVAFAGFVVAVPSGRRCVHIIRIRNRIEYADRRCRDFVTLPLMIVAMHVCDSESTDVFRRTFRFVSEPALRRVWRKGG